MENNKTEIDDTLHNRVFIAIGKGLFEDLRKSYWFPTFKKTLYLRVDQVTTYEDILTNSQSCDNLKSHIQSLIDKNNLNLQITSKSDKYNYLDKRYICSISFAKK